MAIPLPDRFRKKPMMPPPGAKKGVVIAVGIGKPKPGDDPMKDDDPLADDAPPDMPAGASGAGAGASGAEPDGDEQGATMTPEEAIVLRADDKTCQSCKNWGETDGSCSVVPEGAPYDAGDRCLRGYEAMGDNDADDTGDDAGDDSGASAPPMPPAGAGMGQ
jgi:hypothetical protein